MRIKVPGKLMIAGEFAVLEPKQKLIVTAVNKFVYIDIERSEFNNLSLTDFHLHHLTWKWETDNLIINHEDSRTEFVKNAMEVTYRYLHEQKVDVYPVALSIHSELDDKSGIKYGLGSSAAVVTAVVRAILTEFLDEKPHNLLIFKLASIAHVRTQGNGSGADIAASAYHGILTYTSFQAEWLLRELEITNSITSLVNKKWTYLTIERTDFPSDTEMHVAWTGNAASTKHLVAKIKQLKNEAYDTFLQNSHDAVEIILKGMRINQSDLFYDGIERNRQALAELGNVANVEIETEKLRLLAMEAKKVSGAGKLSGAGGGDCGIAFIAKKQNEELLYSGWINHGIIPLDLSVYEGE